MMIEDVRRWTFDDRKAVLPLVTVEFSGIDLNVRANLSKIVGTFRIHIGVLIIVRNLRRGLV